MAVTVVTGVGTGYASTTDPAFTLGASPVEDDIILVVVSSTTNAAMAVPSGWVNVLGGTTLIVPTATEFATAVLYHVVTAAEDTANTTTWTLTGLWTAAKIGDLAAVALRGVDTGAIVDGFGTISDSTNLVTPHILPAIASGDISTSNDLVVRVVSKDGTGTYTTPAAHTVGYTSNTNQGVWLGTRDALTTSGVAVAAVNITPNSGDEYTGVSVAFTASAGAITLTVADARQTQTADSVALTQHHTLAVAEARQLQAVDSPTLTQHHLLVAADARQLQATDSITVTYHPPSGVTLTVADARQTQTAETPALTQHHVAAPADTRQLQATDPVALTQHHSLTVQDARQLHTADQPALTQHRVLAVQDARQLQAADQPTLTQHHILAVQDARQLQSSDPIGVVYHPPGAVGLTVADARQLHTADPVALTQHNLLAAADSRHNHAADTPTLTYHPPPGTALTVHDSRHNHAADSPALTQHHILPPTDPRQTQTSDSPALTQHHHLTVHDARQTQRASNITFGRPPTVNHPNLQVQTNRSTLHTPTGGTLLLTPHRHTLNLED